MLSLLKLKYNFTADFFSNKSVYPFYEKVYNKTNGECLLNRTPVSTKFEDKIYVVNHIPPYLDLKINTSNVSYSCFKTHYLNGFLVNLEDYDSVTAYMKEQFGAKSRSKMRAYLKRLETCFPIRYKMFYGNISKKEYDFLFERFLLMIKRRFSQRMDTHEAMKNWDYLKKTTYSRILEKEASLFVIYDAEKPIDICLNYHYQNIFYDSIRSYDIDYSKFRLGHIDILKQLEWCLENDYTIFDLSYGDLDYKRKWCNTVYEFEQHVLFPKNSLLKRVSAFFILQLIILKGYLKKKKVHVLFKKVKSILKRNPEKITEYLEPRFDVIPISENPLFEKVDEIDINKEEHAPLRKEVYDFQYTQFEASRDIKVYKIIDHKDSYLIYGNKNSRKIVLK